MIHTENFVLIDKESRMLLLLEIQIQGFMMEQNTQ